MSGIALHERRDRHRAEKDCASPASGRCLFPSVVRRMRVRVETSFGVPIVSKASRDGGQTKQIAGTEQTWFKLNVAG